MQSGGGITDVIGTLKDWAYRKRITIVRRTVLVAVFILLNSMLFGVGSFGRHPLLRFVLLPNASCRYIDNAPTYCYYYSLQNWLTGGWSTSYLELVIPILVVLVLVLIAGRAWCSWLCPFGLMQEILMSIRGLIGIKHIQLSYKWVAFLDQLKYAILFFSILIAISIGIPYLGLPINLSVPIPLMDYSHNVSFALPFCQICPAKGFFTVLQMGVGLIPINRLPPIAVAMLLLFLVGSFFIRMFWCRVCPMGAFMALFSRRSLFWLRKEPSRCTKCRVCLRVCPQDFQEVYEQMDKRNITGGECTMCGRCVESCPEKEALSYNILNFSILKSKPRR